MANPNPKPTIGQIYAAILEHYYKKENEYRAKHDMAPTGSSHHSGFPMGDDEVERILGWISAEEYWDFLKKDQGVEPPPEYTTPSEEAPRGDGSDDGFPKPKGG